MLRFALVFLCGCQRAPPEPDTDPPVGDTSTVGHDPPPLLATCVDTLELSTGILCALRPSELDPRTHDVYGTDTAADAAIGFGYHVVGIPNAPAADAGLWVHFGGTYGRPYDPEQDAYASSLWLGELLGQGYLVVQPAYANRWSVNEDCQSPNPGFQRDDCAGEVREEVLTGVDHSPFRQVDLYDGVDHRLQMVLAHVDGRSDVALPPGLDPFAVDWSQIRVSGHSQGGNLAYYVARRRGVAFGCLLASPYDVPDAVDLQGLPIADWFKEGDSLTPASQVGQVFTSEDPNAGSFRGAGLLIGLNPGEQSFEVSAPPYLNAAGEEVDGHAAPLAAPALAAARAAACSR